MFDEKNVYIRQAEVKATIKQNSSGTFLINDLTVNSSLKNFKKVLHNAFEITMEELNNRNSEYDKKKKNTPTPQKKEKTTKTNAKM